MKAENKAEFKQAVSNILENIYYLKALKDEYLKSKIDNPNQEDVAIISGVITLTQSAERPFTELLKLTR